MTDNEKSWCSILLELFSNSVNLDYESCRLIRWVHGCYSSLGQLAVCLLTVYRHICIHFSIKLTGEGGKKEIDDPDNWPNFPHQNESQSIYSKSNACTLTKGPTGRPVCRYCVGTSGMIRPLIYHRIGLNKLNYVCLSLVDWKHSNGLFQYFHTEEADIVSLQRVSAASACGLTLYFRQTGIIISAQAAIKHVAKCSVSSQHPKLHPARHLLRTTFHGSEQPSRCNVSQSPFVGQNWPDCGIPEVVCCKRVEKNFIAKLATKNIGTAIYCMSISLFTT